MCALASPVPPLLRRSQESVCPSFPCTSSSSSNASQECVSPLFINQIFYLSIEPNAASSSLRSWFVPFVHHLLQSCCHRFEDEVSLVLGILIILSHFSKSFSDFYHAILWDSNIKQYRLQQQVCPSYHAILWDLILPRNVRLEQNKCLLHFLQYKLGIAFYHLILHFRNSQRSWHWN